MHQQCKHSPAGAAVATPTKRRVRHDLARPVVVPYAFIDPDLGVSPLRPRENPRSDTRALAAYRLATA